MISYILYSNLLSIYDEHVIYKTFHLYVAVVDKISKPQRAFILVMFPGNKTATGTNIDFNLILFYLASGLDKVVGFQRSCTENVDDGHCTGDPLYGLVTCVYTCTGELCNSWVRGQLHTLFPANRNNRGTRTLQSRSSVHMIAIISVLLYISRLLEQ